jgi:hypothetical protein
MAWRFPSTGTVVVPAGTYPATPGAADFNVPDAATKVRVGVLRHATWGGDGTTVLEIGALLSFDNGVSFPHKALAARVLGGVIVSAKTGTTVDTTWLEVDLPPGTGRVLRPFATTQISLRTALFVEVT